MGQTRKKPPVTDDQWRGWLREAMDAYFGAAKDIAKLSGLDQDRLSKLASGVLQDVHKVLRVSAAISVPPPKVLLKDELQWRLLNALEDARGAGATDAELELLVRRHEERSVELADAAEKRDSALKPDRGPHPKRRPLSRPADDA